MNEQKVITLQLLAAWVEEWKHNCQLNKVDPCKVEVFIENEGKLYRPFSGSLGFGSEDVKASIKYFDSDVVRFDPKDERPPVGEYWKSRGASATDVSGFVSSKQAGERLLRMVKYILDTDEPKTWLDYREFEPNWIQFKFSAREFDVEKLEEQARANGDILTETIIRQCVKTKEKEH